MKNKIASTLAGITLGLAPALAFAEDKLVSDTAGVLKVLDNLTNWLFSIFMIVAVIFIVLAAFNIMTASGDTEKLKKGKMMLVYTVVAIAVAMLANGITFIVKQLVTV